MKLIPGKVAALAWGLAVCVLAVLCWLSYTAGYPVHTDLLDLLPGSDKDPTVRTLRRMVSGRLGRTTLVLVSHADADTARAAVGLLGRAMEASDVFSELQWRHADRAQAFYDFYFPLRHQVLAPKLRSLLEGTDGSAALIRYLEKELYQPSSMLVGAQLEKDPLLLFPALIRSWGERTDRLELVDGILGVAFEDQYHCLIRAQLKGNPFAEEDQTKFLTAWEGWKKEVASKYPGAELRCSSALRHAAEGRQAMQRDLGRVGLGSTIGILVLVLVTFRSLKQLVLALAAMGISVAAGLGLANLVFHGLHVISIVFGCSLLGVCIDYCLHYFALHRIKPEWQAERAMAGLLPALALGALSSALAFGALGLTPLAGLKQISVIASTGLLAAFMTVACWMPMCLRRPHPQAAHPPAYFRWMARLLEWNRKARRSYLAVVGLLALAGLWGCLHVRTFDSPRAFHHQPPALVAEESFIREATGMSAPAGLVLVEGSSAEEVLGRMEALRLKFDQAKDPPASMGIFLSAFLPSMKRQAQDRQALQVLFKDKAKLEDALKKLGWSERALRGLPEAAALEGTPWLQPETWLASDVSSEARLLWLGESAGVYAALVPVQSLHNRAGLELLTNEIQGVRFLDQETSLTELFRTYRLQSMGWIAAAYGITLLVFLHRHRLGGFRIFLPPVLNCMVTVGLLSLLGESINLMHCLALILVLGLGMDYAVFVVESDAADRAAALGSVTLSALTTVLSYGLLSMSVQPVLHAIGLTILIGIFLAWFFAPIALTAE